MRTSILLAAAAASSMAMAGAASAQSWTYHNIGTEDSVTGWTGTLPSSAGAGDTITVASDGESVFTPFGITHDVSDAVSLNAIWQAAAGNTWENWGNGVWDIPSCVGGVCENGNVPESVGTWIAPGYVWVNGNNAYRILEAGGGVSDIIYTYNNADGVAEFSFNSNVPEPATWAMMILGVGLVGFAARRRAAAVAA